MKVYVLFGDNSDHTGYMHGIYSTEASALKEKERLENCCSYRLVWRVQDWEVEE